MCLTRPPQVLWCSSITVAYAQFANTLFGFGFIFSLGQFDNIWFGLVAGIWFGLFLKYVDLYRSLKFGFVKFVWLGFSLLIFGLIQIFCFGFSLLIFCLIQIFCFGFSLLIFYLVRSFVLCSVC
jgi:hypothetical protein